MLQVVTDDSIDNGQQKISQQLQISVIDNSVIRRIYNTEDVFKKANMSEEYNLDSLADLIVELSEEADDLPRSFWRRIKLRFG